MSSTTAFAPPSSGSPITMGAANKLNVPKDPIMGWTEAADLVIKGMDGAIASKKVTYDFARQMAQEPGGATEITCSAFGDNIIDHMG